MAKRDSSMDSLSSNPNPTNLGDTNPGGTAQHLKDQAKDLASQAKEETTKVAGQAKDQVQGMVTQQKEKIVGQLGSLAGALREAGGKLDEKDGGMGRYAGRAAEQVDRVSNYLRDREIGDVIRDAETFARRRPDVFLGGTFLAGLLLARFFKASGNEQNPWSTGGMNATGPTGATAYRGAGQGYATGDLGYASTTGTTGVTGATGTTTGLGSETLDRTGDSAFDAPRPYTPPVGG
jgi:hypothetical protein